jgi:hypothetical protein
MLEMSRPLPVLRHGSPSIFENLYIKGPGVHHRFYGKGHALPQSGTLPRDPEIRDLRLLMQLPADAVPYKGSYNRETALFGMFLNCM